MRKLFAAVAACLLLGTAAMAEGLLSSFPDPNPPGSDSKYAGFTHGPYVGLTAGYSAGQLAAEGLDFSAQGLLGGAYAGWNFRFPGLVVGAEGDFVLTDINADQDGGLFTFQAKSNYIATLRGRAGVPIGPVLLYGTGGVAFTEAEVSIPGDSDTEGLFGYVVGGGVEIEMTRTLHVRLEGLHYIFDDKDFTLGGSTGNVELDQTMVRVGVGLKLN
jgi:outer membrane immunogenic protein